MSKRFEGWYFKHQNGGETLAIIVGRARDGAFIQVVTGERAYRARYPLSDYRKGREIRLGASRFGRDGIDLCACGADWTLTGRLRYYGLTPVQGDIMGPFRHLPVPCRHTVVSMYHRLEGHACLNGQSAEYTGGTGYIEGDAGSSFPRSYTWVQCSDFERGCSLMASAAYIPIAGMGFWGCIGVVWLRGKEYRLATYRGAKIVCRDETRLRIEQKDLTLNVRFLEPQAGHWLDAPYQGQMKRRIREAPAAPACFELWQGGRLLFQGYSRRASCEYVP